MGQANNRKGFWPVNAIAREVYHVEIAASETIAPGDAVYIDTLEADIAAAGDARILGFAAETAVSNSSGVRTDAMGAKDSRTSLAVHLALPGAVFEGVADADSSALGIGSEVDLIGATGAMMIDADASSTDVFTLIQPHPDDAPATALCRWNFLVNRPALYDGS